MAGHPQVTRDTTRQAKITGHTRVDPFMTKTH
jgi:hypothetical protein